MEDKHDHLVIAGKTFTSRLFTGTGKFSSAELMKKSIIASGSEMATVALRRIDVQTNDDELLTALEISHLTLLPNTSGARTAEEAVFAAELAREALNTNWLKLEIHPDPRYLLPDPIETLKAAEILCKKGFIVLPYIHADPVLCKRLEEVGCAAVMPLGSPIGSNSGLLTRRFLEIIIEQASVPVIIDAGLGLPSHAADAMEIGASAVLINTAMAVCKDPVSMAIAFKKAVEAGRIAYLSGPGKQSNVAHATSPISSFIDSLS